MNHTDGRQQMLSSVFLSAALTIYSVWNSKIFDVILMAKVDI